MTKETDEDSISEIKGSFLIFCRLQKNLFYFHSRECALNMIRPIKGHEKS